MKTPILLLTGLLLMLAGVAQAGTIRCGGKIFEDGMTSPPLRAEVIAKCGEPDFKSWGVLEYTQPGGRSVKVLHFNSADQLVFIDEHSL